MDNFTHVYGSILGAAVGDAMGSVTESKTPEMIKSMFSGYVGDLLPGPKDTFVSGCEPGNVTDDFSLAYFTAEELVKCNGSVSSETAKNALIKWSSYPEFYRFAGPTTKVSVDKLKDEFVPQSELHFLACENGKATNGSAMKIFPVGLINPGNVDKAVEDAITICMPTHDTDASLSGAAAIAAAVATAVTGVSLKEVLQAGLYGAKKGFELGHERGKHVSVPSVEKRIEWAISIGEKGMGWEKTMLELSSLVGAGIAVVESVPCVFGILAACGAQAMDAIKMGVNMGNDTDTVATMAGAISGAMAGYGAFPDRYGDMIDRVNNFDLKKLANNIVEVYY